MEVTDISQDPINCLSRIMITTGGPYQLLLNIMRLIYKCSHDALILKELTVRGKLLLPSANDLLIP